MSEIRNECSVDENQQFHDWQYFQTLEAIAMFGKPHSSARFTALTTIAVIIVDKFNTTACMGDTHNVSSDNARRSLEFDDYSIEFAIIQQNSWFSGWGTSFRVPRVLSEFKHVYDVVEFLRNLSIPIAFVSNFHTEITCYCWKNLVLEQLRIEFTICWGGTLSGSSGCYQNLSPIWHYGAIIQGIWRNTCNNWTIP